MRFDALRRLGIRRTLAGALASGLAAVAAVSGVGAPAAVAYQGVPQDTLVSDDPTGTTPHVLDGVVNSIAVVGDRIILGGTFTRAADPDQDVEYARHGLLAFDRSTGTIDPVFDPDVDGRVSSVVPGPDGSVFVGGDFTHVGGKPIARLARLDARTGAPVPGFIPAAPDREVRDLEYRAGRLFVAGEFTHFGRQTRSALAEVDPDTGALLPGVDLTFSRGRYGGPVLVHKIDVTDGATRMVLIGNFSAIDGVARSEVAVLDLDPGGAGVADWNTQRFAGRCGRSFFFDTRDVELSPDNSYFVIVATGTTGPPSQLCDAASRWEMSATGDAVQPTWVDYTGGDSLYATVITDTAVYVGGHQRWLNNPFGNNTAEPGAVGRSGIAALDPVNGLPLSWNPGRTRGFGVQDLLATPDGLYMGSDTVKANGEYHARIAFFPLAGGRSVPQPADFALPADVYRLGARPGHRGTADWSVRRRTLDPSVGPATRLDSSISWRRARASTLVDGQLYSAWSGGHLFRRSFSNARLGPRQEVDLLRLRTFGTALAHMGGLFYSRGRLYYTRNDRPGLYSRAFTVEDDVVGAQQRTDQADGSLVPWSRVKGLFLAGGRLYWVHRESGVLSSIRWAHGKPVPNTSRRVSGPRIDGIDWRARSMVAAPTGPNAAPSADVRRTCTALDCAFDASASSDSDGQLVRYAWDFGDGQTAAGPSPRTDHRYAVDGTYTVTVTVTDDRGATAQASREVIVSSRPSPIGFVDSTSTTRTASAFNFTVTVPAQVKPGDSLILAFSDNAAAYAVPGPDGWQQLHDVVGNSMRTALWSRVASAGDAGRDVTVSLPKRAKGNLTVLAYRGTDGDPVETSAARPETELSSAHTTPRLDVEQPGSWVLSFWADQTSDSTQWSEPSGQARRQVYIGSGAGHVGVLVTDSGGEVPTGTAGRLTARSDAASRSATTATLVLAPAPVA